MKSKIKKSLGTLSKKVTTADKIPEPEPKKETNYSDIPEWAKLVLNYCEKQGVTPEDLILSHKEQNKPPKSKKGTSTSKSEKTTVLAGKDNNVGHSNWFTDYRKNKTGIK